MLDFTDEHIEATKKLFQAVVVAASNMGNALLEIYLRLGLGCGFLRRKMPDEVKARTTDEVWVYLSALLVSMVETWPTRPSLEDLERIITFLEGALIKAQRPNIWPEYASYRLRFREGRSSLGVPDPKLFGPMYGLHEEFMIRLSLAWEVPSSARVSPYAPNWVRKKKSEVADTFSLAIWEMTQKIEDWFRKALEELWPPR